MEEDSMMSSRPNQKNSAEGNNAPTDVNNMDVDQVNQKRRRLTAGQKMIANGKTFAQAIEVIREQERSLGGAKRQRSDNSQPENPPKRKADISYRDAVAIAAENFPEEELSLEQLNKVDNAIMDAVEKIPIDGTRMLGISAQSFIDFGPALQVQSEMG